MGSTLDGPALLKWLSSFVIMTTRSLALSSYRVMVLFKSCADALVWLKANKTKRWTQGEKHDIQRLVDPQ